MADDGTTPIDSSSVAQTTSTVDNLNTSLNTTNVNLQDIITGMTALGSNASNAFNLMGNATDTLGSMVRVAANNFGSLKDVIGAVSNAMVGFKLVTGTMDPFAGIASKAQDQFGSIHDSIQSMGTELKILGNVAPEGVIKLVRALSDNADAGQKAEGAFLHLLGSTGRLNEVFKDGINLTANLAGETAKYSENIANVALATGHTISQTLGYAQALGEIPDALTQNVDLGERNKGSTDGLTAALKVLSGSGRDFAEVQKVLTTGYESLSGAQGRTSDGTQRSLQLFADITSLTDTLGIRFQDANSILQDVAKSFEFIGDNTDAATRVIGNFTEALRNTGLTARASLDITNQMIKGIQGMEFATKAFLSIRSGGAGGLQGAFQIEQLLRQGRLDQVVSMAQRSLTQQTGRIVTQAEAAASPEAAGQFLRQRQLLQSGVFGIGRGTTDDQATRLLEAIGSGDLNAAMKEVQTGQKALETVAGRGESIQKEMSTSLNEIANWTERTSIAAELTAALQARNLFGRGAPGETGFEQRQRLEGVRTTAQEAARQDRRVGTAGTLETERGRMIDRGAEVLTGGLRGFAESVPAFMAEMSSVIRNGNEGFNRLKTNIAATADEERIRAGIPRGVVQPINQGQTVLDAVTRNAAPPVNRQAALNAAQNIVQQQPRQPVAVTTQPARAPQHHVVEIIAGPELQARIKQRGNGDISVRQQNNANVRIPGSDEPGY